MSKRALPSLCQMNLQNAIANLDDQADVLRSLLKIRPLPAQVIGDIAEALALNAVAKSHLVMADNISTDRLMGNGREK